MAMKGNLEMGQEFFMEIWNGYERSRELEEENKKLKEENKILRKWIKEHVNYQTQADFRNKFENK